MRRFAVLAVALALATLGGRAPARAADATGTVRGKIVLERGRLPMSLSRAVRVTAEDFIGNPVGHVRYREEGGSLKYEITGLPLGGTLLVELTLRQENFPSIGLGSGSGLGVPTLARSDHSSPLYAFVLSHAAPVKAPLDFRVSVTRDPTPLSVSVLGATR